MVTIRLKQSTWHYDPAKPLGPAGGFGRVFRGQDISGNPVAVKKLHLDAEAAAHRELALAADLLNRSLLNVLPVLDSGQDADSDGYYVIMPVAGPSLQSLLEERGHFDTKEACTILSDI